MARLGALVLIIEALHPASPEGAPAQLPADLQLAQQLHQCATVCLISYIFPCIAHLGTTGTCSVYAVSGHCNYSMS